MAWVYVGIGSNIVPERHIRSGLAALRRQFGPLTVSTVYANPAVGFAGDDFFNLVVGFETCLPVRTVAADLRSIESNHRHRGDGPKLGSRALDLDLLLYDDLILREDGLCIPRDEILRHAFVLKPLADVAGGRRHPLLGLSFAELWAAFDQSRERLTPVALEFQGTG
ncbi:MAG: 2-amino-4-hydroxy-6-hydroxymethyldihydropteridine diphosphokinase [Candidatus Contendobacter sp.]